MVEEKLQEPDFYHPPHQLPSLYPKALLILCDTCGYWEVVEDVREGRHWRSDRTLPCNCQICGGTKTVHAVDDDQLLQVKRKIEKDMGEKHVEEPVDVMTLQEGDPVVILDRTSIPPRYSMGIVSTISDTDKIVTVGTQRFASDGWLFTSNKHEKYTKQLLQMTDALKETLYREWLVSHLSAINWGRESLDVLEAAWATYEAHRNKK